MSKKRTNWTEQQKRAIVARGSDVLVTASAGTGKTAVLSGHCVDIVSDKSACPDVWSVLVLTFTEAAADQMRQRIAEQLRKAFLQSGDTHLRDQLILLQGADISTIHSFCRRLITEHFYKLGLDPTFRVIDADEARLLKAQALEQTIDWAWEQGNLAQGLQQLFSRRDLRVSEGFPAKITVLSDFLDGVVARRQWYERASVLAEAVNPFAGQLGQRQRQIITEKLRGILEQLEHCRKLYERQGEGNWGAVCRETFIKPVRRCAELLKAGDWDQFSRAIRDFKKPKVYKPKGIAEPADELIQGTVRKAMGAFDKLTELAVLNPDYLDRVSAAAGVQTKVLIELVRKFDRLYARAKRALNCMDFADLEHYALKLLSDEDSSQDSPSPSQTALALRSRYKYIFVDEYQDINSVQQAILDLLGAGDNVFVVGDVKQSIYAWRGAEPEIFLGRLKSASTDSGDPRGGLRVDLNVNFRSAQGILDFVNALFGRIMMTSFAKIDYDESARLKPGIADGPKKAGESHTEPVVELHILDEGDQGSEERGEQVSESLEQGDLDIISGRQRQAAMIARRIRKMVGVETGRPEFQVYDKQQDKSRDVEYRDMVILMRSPANRARDYVEVLRLAGVPVSCEGIAGYFEATEISDLLCLLKVLDNPQRDIELAAVLRSPLFQVSDTELAKIRIQSRTEQLEQNFYELVVRYCDCGSDATLAEKLRGALEQIERWRTVARRDSLADLIWQIYRETNYLSFVSALANGRTRRANLLRLHDRAIQFEGFASSGGIASLARFVEFVEKLQEAGQDWAPAEPDSSAQNAVRILSVHKSKGLEFPVVFLAELNSRFNKTDIQDECLTSAEHTLGLQIIDRKSNSKISSLAHQVIAEEKLSSRLAEEMRILYVATTRARERLILTASAKKKHCRDIVCRGFVFGGQGASDWQLRGSQNPFEWLLYGLCDQKSLHEAFETSMAQEAVDEGLFDVRLYEQSQLRELSGYILKLKTKGSRRPRKGGGKSEDKQAGEKLLSEIKRSLGRQYTFGDAPFVPAKRSVTQMTHRDDEYVRVDYSGALERKLGDVSAGEDDLTGSVEPRLVGTATHILIARLDLSRPVTAKVVEETRDRLVVDGIVAEAAAERIDTESIVRFFESELGQAALDGNNTVWREWPFTFALPAVEFSDSSHKARGTSNDAIVVQGIIDILVKTSQGLLVIDFKTDKVTAEEVAGRTELYRRQLEYYSRAAHAILKAKTIGKWLYFLAPGCAIEV